MNAPQKSLASRTLIITTAAAAVLLLLFLIGYAANVFLVFFLCILFALFLRGTSHWLSRHSFLSDTWALLVVILVLGSTIGVGSWFLAPSVAAQMSALISEIPKAAGEMEKQIQQYEWGRQLFNNSGFAELYQRIPNAFSKAGLFLSSTLGIVVNIVVVLFVGLYLAANPYLYIDGFLKLLPQNNRARGREVLFTLGHTLQRWLLGRFILMISNGVLTAIGLTLLGVPLAVPLGIIAGLLNFIPNLGPFLAGIPAVLIAYVRSPALGLYVVLFYLGYQMLDGYLFTPLVQKKTISMPPALTIMAQVLLGVLLGTMGVLVAVPLSAVALVTTKMLYVEDVLGEPVSLKARDKSD